VDFSQILDLDLPGGFRTYGGPAIHSAGSDKLMVVKRHLFFFFFRN